MAGGGLRCQGAVGMNIPGGQRLADSGRAAFLAVLTREGCGEVGSDVRAGDQLERVVEAIQNAANTGKIGDGKIFVYDLERVMRIRTGELDGDAL